MRTYTGDGPLADRTAIITGASHGLGYEIARRYLVSGASILICARNAADLTRATDELSQGVKKGQQVASIVADISNAESVEALVNFAFEKFEKVDILVNNAGIYGPKGSIDKVSWKDWVDSININLLGSVGMCRAIVPRMKACGYGKIVQLSGGGATSPLPNLSAYAVAKAGIVGFVETLALELVEYGIDVNALAPGALNTRLFDEILSAGPEAVGEIFYNKALEQRASGGSGLEKGAELAVFLGSGESDGISGKLISAIWDPWRDLPEHRTDLDKSDIYTLRRIVPSDRGMNW